MISPFKSLFFLVALLLSLLLLSFAFPKEGVTLYADYKLRFFSTEEIFEAPEAKKDIANILKLADKLSLSDSDTLLSSTDSLNITDSKDSLPNLITTIQYKNISAIQAFFNALDELKVNKTSIRVLHYGDSQIEGDRITDYLRMKLQSQFGGNGPGLISFMPISQSTCCKVDWGYGWDRYQAFLGKDKRVNHNNYGPAGCFTRFCRYKEIYDTSVYISTNVLISTNKNAGSNNVGYSKIKLFYGGAKTKTWCEFYDGPALAGADSLDAGGNFRIREFSISPGSTQHEFKFKGKDSPDFYGASLEKETGIYVDNIAQRGSSGTFFHHINFSQLNSFYNHLNVKLIILQYGGNALPSLKNKEMIANFASYYRGQIAILKKAAPGASILFIGPADMSVKEGTEYVTHPLLEDLRDALKKVAFDTNCAYFDMYDCMGGKNSMLSWVEQKLAATDYIHFSPQGARKIATLLYASLISNYNSYSKNKK